MAVRPGRLAAGFALCAALTAVLPVAALADQAPHHARPPVPTVNAVSPSTVAAHHAVKVTISGHHFEHVTAVVFGSAVVRSVRVRPDGRLTVTAPSHGAGLVDIRVRTRSGTSRPVRADRISYLGRPAIRTTNLPSASTAAAYRGVLRTGDGRAGTWRLVGGGILPPGLHLSGDAIIGRATSAAIDPITVRFVDRAGQHVDRQLTVFVGDTHWAASTLPLPAGAVTGSGDLQGVDCPSSTMCAAIGSYQTSDGKPHGLLASRTDGVWTTTALRPNGPIAYPNSTIQTRSVSCGAPGSCVAIAQDYNDVAPVIATLADGVWTVQDAPVLAGSSLNRFRAVSCSGPSSCVAVGDHGAGGFIDTLADGVWTASAPPGTVSGDATLLDVACTQPGRCTVAGKDNDVTAHRNEPLVLTSTNGEWQQVDVPAPTNVLEQDPYSTVLRAVSCTAADTCTAVGEDNGLALVEREAAGVWTATSPPLGERASLSTVSCSGARCLAGGGYHGPVLGVLRDGTWTSLDLPAGTAGVTSVSCGGEGACGFTGAVVAAGDGVRVGFVGVYSSDRVTVQQAPLPPDAGRVPTYTTSATSQLSCHDGCTAVGGYRTRDGLGGAPLTDTYLP